MVDQVYQQSARRSGKTAKAGTAAKTGNAERTRLYRAVHAACRANGIDDDDRKALQSEMFGKPSLSDMTMAEITRLLDQLNRNRKAPAGHRAHIGKVRALWWSLYWLGEVDHTDDRTIGAFVKRQTGVSALRWLDHRSAPSVIEALKSWLGRAGVKWPTLTETAVVQKSLPAFTANHHERIAVIHAQHDKLDRHLPFRASGDYIAGLGYDRTAALPNLQIVELDGLIRHLGELIRRQGA